MRTGFWSPEPASKRRPVNWSRTAAPTTLSPLPRRLRIWMREPRLYPPDPNMPQVVYLGDELGEIELLDALKSGDIDAVARGEIGNRDAESAYGGDFAGHARSTTR